VDHEEIQAYIRSKSRERKEKEKENEAKEIIKGLKLKQNLTELSNKAS